MIISEKHKYVFIQLPHTACTAVGKELVELYDGRPFLHKHAMYHHLERELGADVKDYFVFSSIRNPMDELISVYHKFKTNHNSQYTDPSNWKSNGGWLSSRGLRQFRFVYEDGATFEDFFKRFFRLPYANMSILAHDRLDFLIRYERLQDDFSTLLEKLGLEQSRPLPIVNPTKKEDRLSHAYYSSRVSAQAAFVLGPLMHELGYPFPEEWGRNRPSLSSKVAYRIVRGVRTAFWRYVA